MKGGTAMDKTFRAVALTVLAIISFSASAGLGVLLTLIEKEK